MKVRSVAGAADVWCVRCAPYVQKQEFVICHRGGVRGWSVRRLIVDSRQDDDRECHWEGGKWEIIPGVSTSGFWCASVLSFPSDESSHPVGNFAERS